MNHLIPFDYNQNHQVRVIDRDGEPWWVLTDICRILELGNASQVAIRLDPEDRDTIPFAQVSPGIIYNDRGLMQPPSSKFIIVSESGLYDVLLRSNKPEARKFSRWVRREVLPAIRKTGTYTHPDKQTDDLTATSRQILGLDHQLQTVWGAYEVLGETLNQLSYQFDQINDEYRSTHNLPMGECRRITLADLLSEYRERTGHSTTEMERISGISNSTIRSLLEPGKRNIMPQTMVKLTRFGFPLDVIKAAAIQTAAN